MDTYHAICVRWNKAWDTYTIRVYFESYGPTYDSPSMVLAHLPTPIREYVALLNMEVAGQPARPAIEGAAQQATLPGIGYVYYALEEARIEREYWFRSTVEKSSELTQIFEAYKEP